MKKIPKLLQKYFWDVDPQTIDSIKHKQYIIERLLEFGDEKAASWLERQYARRAIVTVLEHSRKISKRSANFWRLRLGVSK